MAKIILDECQKEAIRSAFKNRITIITGPGGSGKSLVCKYICELAKTLGKTVRLIAPTGKAAQVLTSKTGCGAATIHRSLKMRPGDEMPREVIKEDLLLVDEISMCGIDTMYAVMQALASNAWGNIILVGDKNQLPSVSPGNFLSDIIASNCANVVVLDKIHRQDEQSFIPVLANDISRGKSVEIPGNAKDIKWHNISLSNFHDSIIEYIDAFLKEGHEMSELQIISPMKKGDCGVFKLNDVIQKKMASVNGTGDKKIITKYCEFFVGDRVIQIENNYDKMIFNGDIGIITDLGEKVMNSSVSDKAERYITVDFYGEEITYTEDEFDQLQLAWAITVHKFQGSQSPYVLFVMANEHRIMMSKELVYTAFTRAEKELDIFGHENMLKLAPTRSIIKKRFTNLVRIIQELSGNKKLLKVLTAAKKGDSK